MNAAQYYTMLVRAARDGTFPSIDRNDNDKCLYRGPNNTRCAIGLLIPDEKYRPSIEGESCYDDKVLECFTIPVGLTKGDLSEIQYSHDTASNQEDGWDPDLFIARINKLKCFQECKHD